jgi:heme exporter protein B
MIGAFTGLFRHDLRLALRQGGDTGLVLGFFVLAVVLFPLGVGPEPALLQRIGAGIIWVAALLAALLSLDRLFEADYRDGGLELLALSELPLELAVLAKCAAHWVLTGLPLAVVSPLLALFVDLESTTILTLVLGLAIGTPALSLIGAVAAVDPRSAAPGGRAVDPGTAALCAATRLWCGCCGGQRSGHRRARQSADSRRVEPRCPRPLPVGERCGIASGAGLRFGSTTPSCAKSSR